MAPVALILSSVGRASWAFAPALIATVNSSAIGMCLIADSFEGSTRSTWSGGASGPAYPRSQAAFSLPVKTDRATSLIYALPGKRHGEDRAPETSWVVGRAGDVPSRARPGIRVLRPLRDFGGATLERRAHPAAGPAHRNPGRGRRL